MTTKINIPNVIFDSSFSGLSNSQNNTATFAMPSQTLSGNEVRIVGNPTASLNNTNAITSVQVNFGNVETVWRPINGYIQLTVGGPSYDILVTIKYVASVLNFTIIIADDTGLSNTVPAINFTFRINTYIAPF